MPFLHVLGGEGQAEQRRFDETAFGERRLEAVRDRFHRIPHRHRRVRGPGLRQRARLGGQRGGRHRRGSRGRSGAPRRRRSSPRRARVSIARPFPTSLGSRCVPANPGVSPSFTSGWPNFAVSAASRTVQAMASSQPPPSAKPLTAAMTGLPRCSMRSNTRWPSSACALAASGVSVASSCDVRAGHERLVAGSGQDDGPHRRVGLQAAHRVAQFGQRGRVERVEHLRPVDRDGGDGPVDRDEEVFVRHRVTRSRARLYPTPESAPAAAAAPSASAARSKTSD